MRQGGFLISPVAHMGDDGVRHERQNTLQQSQAGAQDGYADERACQLCAEGFFEWCLHADLLHGKLTGGFEEQQACEMIQMPPKFMRWGADGADGGEMALCQRMLNDDNGLHAGHFAAFAGAGKVFQCRVDGHVTMMA